MSVPTRIGWTGWIAATIVGYGMGTTLSTLLVGATARPLSPALGGIASVFVFGAVIGIVVGVAQFAAIRSRLVPWRRWILATAFGAAVGFAVAAPVGEVLGNAIDPAVNVVIGEGIIEMTSGAIVGLAIGFAQSLVLRPVLPMGRWWLVASAVGAGLGYGAATAVLELFELPILKTNLAPSFGAILGIFIGVAQGVIFWSRRTTTSI